MLCGRRGVAGPIVVEFEGGAASVLVSGVRTDPAVIGGPVDVVLLTVKAHQTAAAGDWLARLCGASTIVAVLQNGVEQVERASPLVGAACVLPVVVHCTAVTDAPGRVRVVTPMRLITPVSPEASVLAALLGPGGVAVECTDDFVTAQWRKLCLNAVAGIMAATAKTAIVFRSAETRVLAHRLALECIRVGRAEGAHLEDGFAEALVSEFEALPAESGTSILKDRLASRPLEWDARNGVIRRLGLRHGVPTPVSDVLVPILAAASGAG
jgi:2-dehydropantoate 2-reductase